MGRIHAAAIVVSAAMCGCKSEVPLSIEDLPGYYICNLPGPAQTVELRKDGTFTQTIESADFGIYVGHWTTDAPAVKVHVMLSPYHFHWPSDIAIGDKMGLWMANAKRSSRRVLLVVDDDDGLYCERSP